MTRRIFLGLWTIITPLVLTLFSTGAAVPIPRITPPTLDPKLHKNYTETIPGTKEQKVIFDMVAIPGGTFFMGSPKHEKGRKADEGPQHPVRIRPFWMGKCEVTWDEFDVYHHSNPRNKPTLHVINQRKHGDAVTRPTAPYVDETYGMGREGHPALGITHHAAMEYCHWLSKKTGKKYRLPTEAEWEWACRAGTATARFWGDSEKVLSEYACHEKNSEEVTFKVGKLKPNPWGLYDGYGNVSEWCLDHYAKEDYRQYSLLKLTLSPVRLPTKKHYSHVTRGGSYLSPASECRSASRVGSDPKWNQFDPTIPQSIWWLSNADFVGFRVVRAVTEQENLRKLRSRVTP